MTRELYCFIDNDCAFHFVHFDMQLNHCNCDVTSYRLQEIHILTVEQGTMPETITNWISQIHCEDFVGMCSIEIKLERFVDPFTSHCMCTAFIYIKYYYTQHWYTIHTYQYEHSKNRFWVKKIETPVFGELLIYFSTI